MDEPSSDINRGVSEDIIDTMKLCSDSSRLEEDDHSTDHEFQHGTGNHSLVNTEQIPFVFTRELLAAGVIPANRYWYCVANQITTCYGASCGLSTYRSRLEMGDRSLLQMALLNLDGAKLQTIEAGWRRTGIDPNNNPKEAQLFVFFTTAGYDPNGSADYVMGYYPTYKGWEQVHPTIKPGVNLAYSQIGRIPLEIALKWQLVSDRWYLTTNGTVIGYFPCELFRKNQPDATKTLADHATLANFQGEVYDSASPNPGDTTSDMGSGLPPETGWSNAAFIRNMQIQKKQTLTSTNMTNLVPSPGYPSSTDQSKYSLKFVSIADPSWGSYMFLGGPGASIKDWIDWDTIGGTFVPGSPVTAISRGEKLIDLFICGLDGNVYTSFWNTSVGFSSWNGEWANIGSVKNRFLPGIKVTAVSRMKDVIDLFVCGKDGQIYNCFWTLATGWSGLGGWTPLGSPSSASAATVTAIARSQGNLALFVMGTEGAVHTKRWQEVSGWSEWETVPLVLVGILNVAAISRKKEEIWLFVCGSDGNIHFGGWTEGATPREWDGDGEGHWQSIGKAPDGVLFAAGSPITVVSRSETSVDLFISASDGRVYTSNWTLATGFAITWSPIGDKVFEATYSITAVARKSDWLDIFVCSLDGHVYTSLWSEASGTWNGAEGKWTLLKGEAGTFPIAANIAAVSKSRENLDVFVVNINGVVNQTQWEN